MWPGVNNWRRNGRLVCRLIKRTGAQTIIARGPFAANLALEAKKQMPHIRVVFDARGAYKAEFHEFNVGTSPQLNQTISDIEACAVGNADFRIAVSQELVNYWRRTFDYRSDQHTIIPCTLRDMPAPVSNKDEVRKRFGFSPADIVVVYSGSNAGWQSFDELDRLLPDLFRRDDKIRLLLLTGEVSELQLIKDFPERIRHTWIAQNEIAEVLSACDYGWLIRNQSVTNSVASPVKFAEYLSCGLRVLISPGLGDFTAFVENYQCGFVVTDRLPDLSPATDEQRKANRLLAGRHFTKEVFGANYKAVAG